MEMTNEQLPCAIKIQAQLHDLAYCKGYNDAMQFVAETIANVPLMFFPLPSTERALADLRGRAKAAEKEFSGRAKAAEKAAKQLNPKPYPKPQPPTQ